MNKCWHPVRVVAIAVLAVLCSVSGASAQEPVTMPPNLKALPATDLSLLPNSSTGTIGLRFSASSWNSGTGPLQLEGGPVDTGSGKQQVYQRLFTTDGGSVLHLAGWFEYHPTHHHIHFNDYALYTLQPVNAPGGTQRTGSKTTFCLMDTDPINTQLPGAPSQPVYSDCGETVQGLSVGWADTYLSHLPGQELDFTNNANGTYLLKIEVDPKRLLVEGDENDNESCVLVKITKPSSVTVLDSSGRCSAVASITPNSAAAGSSVAVTITGYEFTAGMAVTFESGNGPRPVASNVVLAADTEGLDTITATVTVPNKKAGKDPVWDLRVGSAGVLRDAFRVTR